MTKKKTRLEIARVELEKIKDKGKLTAENVVKEAKKKSSPLHDYFEWDDNIAGEKFRLVQARMLINYVIEPAEDDDEDKVYSYEIVKTNGDKEYKHIDEILTQAEWRDQILHQSVSYLDFFRKKYNKYRFEELRGVMSEISKLPEVLSITQNGRTKPTKPTNRKVTVKAN